ncbi:hypothetical protein CKO18_08815 [Rhodoferax fermentans]|uniref:Uncharacterized protein n=1 Tax=Rhodoferax fermentans TaxID=28066 RepID=A0A1T1AQM4_RHOFE|nr:hypothetical protein [Rhodoferax fermentans]OOV06409.1 hypothetical protein RF819_06420 [Rhodoferax fermentans]
MAKIELVLRNHLNAISKIIVQQRYFDFFQTMNVAKMQIISPTSAPKARQAVRTWSLATDRNAILQALMHSRFDTGLTPVSTCHA